MSPIFPTHTLDLLNAVYSSMGLEFVQLGFFVCCFLLNIDFEGRELSMVVLFW